MTIDFTGGCPHCNTTDGYLNIGRNHWFVCDEHKVKWLRGSNLFSGWRNETPQTWEENSVLLATYEQVEPVFENASGTA